MHILKITAITQNSSLKKMYHLIPFTKHWTEIYLPIVEAAQEKKKGKSFHCIESIANLANLSMRWRELPSPFVAIETNIGGEFTEKFLLPQYNVYFFVKASYDHVGTSDFEFDKRNHFSISAGCNF